MLAAKFLPLIRNGLRQIVPPVIATLLAAVLIAGYNRAFTGHLLQPRMAAVQGKIGIPDEAVPGAPAQPRESAVTSVAEVATPVLEARAGERIFAKDDEREAAKDATPLKVAAPLAAPAVAEPAPAPPVRVTRRAEPRLVERRPIESYPAPAPVVVAQPPVIVAQPMIATAPMAVPQPTMQQPVGAPSVMQNPQVIGAKPMVTVPDRPRAPQSPYAAQPPYQAAEPDVAAPLPPQGGALERFVDTFRPSSIFARMREFGERIEATGNEILPNVRPQ